MGMWPSYRLLQTWLTPSLTESIFKNLVNIPPQILITSYQIRQIHNACIGYE